MVDISDQNVISFIVPVLNREKYIGQCLEHILKEAGEQDEVIVVDNGSTDGTLRIVGQYPRAKILQEPEVTIAALRNRGARAAMGDLFAFIDSDCLVCSGWRNAVIGAMSDQGIAATGSASYDLPPSTSWVERAWLPPRPVAQAKVRYLISGNLVIRRNVFEKIAGFNEKLVTDEDTEISLKLYASDYYMLDAPQARTVHLGNAKTIRQFIRQLRWHSTSILHTICPGRIDKPMIMTLVFILCCLFSVLTVPLWSFSRTGIFVALGFVLLAPILTAFYRAYGYRRPRYFLHLALLAFVYYSVRSAMIVEILSKRALKGLRGRGNHD